MTLTQMNYIITISETGSLNKAAEALYISQPSLTNAVKELEKELGIIIFNRSICGKIIHWQMRNPSATASWQNIPACPSNREIRAVFICQRRFCLPMNIPEQSRLRIGRLC